MSKRKNPPVKNQREREQYSREMRKQNRIDTTGRYGSDMLSGSGEFVSASPYADEAEYVGTATPSLKTRASRNKDKIFDWVIAGILIPALFAAFGWAYTQNGKLEVLTYRVSEIEERIDGLTTDMLTKEVFKLQLELATKDMEGLIPDLSSVEERLEAIETRLDELEEQPDE